MSTTISWTDETWNVTRGCRRVSAGCENCYAERQANRFKGAGGAYEGLIKLVSREVRQFKMVRGEPTGDFRTITRTEPRWSGETKFAVEHLADPLRWKKPRRIFVDSMSDLFYEGFTNEQIAAVFGVMAACPQHTFQCLTKRPKRMREWFAWLATKESPGIALVDALDGICKLDDASDARFVDLHWQSSVAVTVDGSTAGWVTPKRWPLPNVWLGVSVENQDAADERIPELLQTPAAIRFLSCEPLLGPVDLRGLERANMWSGGDWLRSYRFERQHDDGRTEVLEERKERLGWVIAGCESGPGARPCDVAWLRSIRDQCAAAGVPYFLKQAEESADCGEDRLLDAGDDDSIAYDDGSRMMARRPGGHHIIELPYLDGVQHASFPEVRHG